MSLTKRIIPLILINNGRCVKGVQFHDHRDVGDPVQVGKVFEAQGADELIVLRLAPETAPFSEFLGILDDLSRNCFIPISAGGGVRTKEQAIELIRHGADKVVLGSHAIKDSCLIDEIAAKLGRQAIVVCVDYAVEPLWCPALNAHPIGELLLQHVARDGMRVGYDLETLTAVVPSMSVPVLVGCGPENPGDLARAFDMGADGCVVGSMFYFTDQSPIKVKSYLINKGYSIRGWN